MADSQNKTIEKAIEFGYKACFEELYARYYETISNEFDFVPGSSADEEFRKKITQLAQEFNIATLHG